MRIRHILSEAVDNNEITKVEGLIAIECVKAEVMKQVLVPVKLPAESSTEKADRLKESDC